MTQADAADAGPPSSSSMGRPLPAPTTSKLEIRGLNAYYGKARIIKDIDIDIPASKVTAVIGPSGCGKSTFLRCINRMHEQTPGAHAAGSVLLDGIDIYDRAIDPVRLRRRVGMVFQKPNPFPTMTIRDNVLAGHTLNGSRSRTKTISSSAPSGRSPSGTR